MLMSIEKAKKAITYIIIPISREPDILKTLNTFSLSPLRAKFNCTFCSWIFLKKKILKSSVTVPYSTHFTAFIVNFEIITT